MKLSERETERIEREASDAGVLDHYCALVAGGSSPRFALMVAMRRAPGTKGTDATFNKLQRQQMQDDYEDETREKIVKIARKAGINTAGKTYNGQLGRYDDPYAWVSDTSDVRSTAKTKGLSLRGQVNVENEPAPLQKKRMSDRLVNETAQEYMAADPKLAKKVRSSRSAARELRERIIEKHAPKKK